MSDHLGSSHTSFYRSWRILLLHFLWDRRNVVIKSVTSSKETDCQESLGLDNLETHSLICKSQAGMLQTERYFSFIAKFEITPQKHVAALMTTWIALLLGFNSCALQRLKYRNHIPLRFQTVLLGWKIFYSQCSQELLQKFSFRPKLNWFKAPHKMKKFFFITSSCDKALIKLLTNDRTSCITVDLFHTFPIRNQPQWAEHFSVSTAAWHINCSSVKVCMFNSQQETFLHEVCISKQVEFLNHH